MGSAMVKAQVFAKQKIRYYALFLAAVTLFIFLSSRRITQTVSGEELAVLSCFNDIFQVGLTQHLRDSGLKPLDLALVHPHLYMLTVLWAYALFGYHDVSARLVGVFTGILTILLVFIIVQRFALGDRLRRIKIAGLVSLSYALAPTTITGALLTQIDTTVLIPLLLCVVLSATRYVVEKKRIWLVWLCLNVVFSFWARLSTPGVIVTLIAIYFLASKAEVSIKRMIILTLAGGVLAFLVLWFIYCKILGIPWFRLFGYTTSVIYRFGIVRSVVQNIQNILYVVLWLGPVTLFTFLNSRTLFSAQPKRHRTIRHISFLRFSDFNQFYFYLWHSSWLPALSQSSHPFGLYRCRINAFPREGIVFASPSNSTYFFACIFSATYYYRRSAL
ncbi:MAG: hypothetical protein NC923_00790 [Candidatus Omnitrophica bacterium]|nr:hypothetical protein [Candidatus Omnitrophota bacterium]